MTKLLMVTHYFDSHQSGIELVARKLFDGLSHEQCEVAWAAADVTPPPPDGPNQKLLPLNAWNGVERKLGVPIPVPSLGAILKLKRAVGEADFVLVHDCLYLSNIMAFLIARTKRIPVMIVQHIGMVPYTNPALNLLMKIANVLVARPMLRSADQVVFISEITKNYFKPINFKHPPEMIFNGVDTELFHPATSDDERRALRAKLGLPSNCPVALFVGRFVEKKGLKILREMAAAEHGITWAFAGQGPLDPRQWNAANVKVYSGLRGSALAELYQASNLLVLPSTGEGLPLVIQEAMACGLPVVCGSETATADDALMPFLKGVALSDRDPRRSALEFLSAIRNVLAAGSPALVMKERFEFVRERYSWKTASEKYSAIVAKLTAETANKRSQPAHPANNPVADRHS